MGPIRLWSDIIFLKRERLPRHPNGMRFTAIGSNGAVFSREYYSVGGGFIVTDEETEEPPSATGLAVPYPFTTAAQLLSMAEAAGLSIPELQRANERAFRTDAEISAGIAEIWQVMQACVERGLKERGELPGGLRVRRRAPALYGRLLAQHGTNELDVLQGMDWANLYALAVNEENAAGGRVVTAPTNGAAGIIPAVLHYYDRFVAGASPKGIETSFLAAAAVGALIKRNASISGAEVGCQGEVGSASAMAAAGLAAALGGTNGQVENAAEIALEHNLGLTCDPDRRVGADSVHRAERVGLGEGDQRGPPGATWGRVALRQSRSGHPDHAGNRAGYGFQVQGDLRRRVGSQRDRLLRRHCDKGGSAGGLS